MLVYAHVMYTICYILPFLAADRHCEVPGLQRGPKKFRVSHGKTYFDVANCRTCQCSDGNATAFCSEGGNCSFLISTEPMNCTLPNGDVLLNGRAMMIGCDVCGCRDGRIECTHSRHCRRPQDTCEKCKRLRPGPVCGPDGRNHLTECAAVNCAGFSPVDLERGPCQSQVRQMVVTRQLMSSVGI